MIEPEDTQASPSLASHLRRALQATEAALAAFNALPHDARYTFNGGYGYARLCAAQTDIQSAKIWSEGIEGVQAGDALADDALRQMNEAQEAAKAKEAANEPMPCEDGA